MYVYRERVNYIYKYNTCTNEPNRTDSGLAFRVWSGRSSKVKERHIYIYIERERDTHMCVYIYICIHTQHT